MSNVDAEEVVMAVRKSEAEAKLRNLYNKLRVNLTLDQIKMIESAVWDARVLRDGKRIKALRLDGWTCARVSIGEAPKDIQFLYKHHYIVTGADGQWYWLSKMGREIHDQLFNANNTLKKSEKQLAKASKTETGVYSPKFQSFPYYTSFAGMNRSDLLAKLKSYNITEFDINTILSAEHHMGDRWKVTSIKPCVHWPKSPTASDKRLMDYGLMYQEDGFYWLSLTGVPFRQLVNDVMNVKPKKEKTEVVVHVAERNMDINLGRDGLRVTVSKLWYVWRNSTEIKQQALQKQYLEFIQGQKMIEEAANGIATSEQRVARLLLEKPRVEVDHRDWTVEMQRASNDKYWASGCSAFWLNPNAYRNGASDFNAEPCQPPEWWVEPTWEPKYVPLDHNKVLDEALLPPPEMEQPKVSGTTYVGCSFTYPMTVETWNSKSEVKESSTRRLVREEYFNIIDDVCGATTCKVDEGTQLGDFFGHDTLVEIIHKVYDRLGCSDLYTLVFNHTIGETINKMVEQVEKLNEKNKKINALDQVIAYLEHVTDNELENYVEVKPSRRAGKGLLDQRFQVEFNGEVRQFVTQEEAANWYKLAKKAHDLKIAELENKAERDKLAQERKVANMIRLNEAKRIVQKRIKNYAEAESIRKGLK